MHKWCLDGIVRRKVISWNVQYSRVLLFDYLSSTRLDGPTARPSASVKHRGLVYWHLMALTLTPAPGYIYLPSRSFY